jgi:hypothetical protein
MPQHRFLLIKSWGYSLWADVEHVMGQLLVAEITGRTPVVYWGMDSMYSESIGTNAYESFFEPVSTYSIEDVINPNFTYYPPVWNYSNVMSEDPDKLKWKHRDVAGMMTSTADVVVSDVNYPITSIIPWIAPKHPLFGMTPHQIYRHLYRTYLVIKPEVDKKVQQFIDTNPYFRDEKPIIGAHVRGNALVHEVNQLYSANDYYHPNIWRFFTNYGARHLFLITDSARIEREYKRLYQFNDVLIVSNSKKRLFHGPILQCNTNYPNKRHKGVELKQDTLDVIKDTYLALQCDFFIGNGYSSLSNAVLRLKDWPESNIKLLY